MKTETEKIRVFLVIKKDERGREYIGRVIKSDMYPSYYAYKNQDDQIIELPEIEISKNDYEAGCCIYF